MTVSGVATAAAEAVAARIVIDATTTDFMMKGTRTACLEFV